MVTLIVELGVGPVVGPMPDLTSPLSQSLGLQHARQSSQLAVTKHSAASRITTYSPSPPSTVAWESPGLGSQGNED